MSDQTPIPGGRPSAYRREYAEFAKLLCERGATDGELAAVLRISRSTLYRWLARRPDFREQVRIGKKAADERVERALYQRCVGYDIEAERLFHFRGEIIRAQTFQHVPADVDAALKWLANRCPDEWSDRRELTGANGAPIELRASVEFMGSAASPAP